MAGYTRQEAATIVDGETINADSFNNEYNQLVNAFDETSGHTHDGTAAEGALVPLIATSDGLNKVQTNDTDNTVDVYVDVASSAVKQVVVSDGAFLPATTNDIDLGSLTFQFKDLHLAGDIIASGLTASTVAITGGTIDGAVIGGTTPAAGTFSTLGATTATLTSAAINGGTINNASVGASTPSTGAFTTLTSTSLEVTNNITVGGTVDGRDVATDGTKLDGIEAGAEVNENSFQTIALTSTGTGVASGGDIVADTTTDTLNLVAGDDITITNDPVTDTITIQTTAGPTNAVAGPASATDSAIALFDGTTGKLIKDSATLIADLGDVDGPASAVNLNVAVFNGTTGKLIADGGQTIAEIIASVPELSPVKLHFLANS